VSIELADTFSTAESISGKPSWLIDTIKRRLDEETVFTVGPTRKPREVQLDAMIASIYGTLLAPFHAALPRSS
jgi:hypothetical protein